MFTFKHKGDFGNIERFLNNAKKVNARKILENYGRQGVDALSAATPMDTGLTARSWGYEIKDTKNGAKIIWTNSNNENGLPVAILIQYGHGTKGGAYIEGIDYINPAMASVFSKIAENLWWEVSRL